MSIPRRAIALSLAAGLLASMSAAPASAAVAVRFHVTLGSSCVDFEGAPSTPYTVTVYDGTEILDRVRATTDTEGYAWACGDVDLVGGLKLRAQATGYTRTITILSLSLQADRITDVVSGRAPAGKSVTVWIGRLATGRYTLYDEYQKHPVANASGAWTVSMKADGGIRGGDYVDIRHETAAGDSFSLYSQVEHMTAQRGSASVHGVFDHGRMAVLELRTSGGAVRGRAYLGDGWDTGTFRTAAGVAVYPRTGDKVVGDFASDAAMTVPAILVTASAATNVVSVRCPGMAGQGVLVEAHKADYSDWGDAVGVINAAGTRTFNLTSQIDLKVGDKLYATCKFDSGDEIARSGVVGS